MRRFRRQFQQHQFVGTARGDSCFPEIWLPLSETTVMQTRMLKETSSVRHSPQSRFVQVI